MNAPRRLRSRILLSIFAVTLGACLVFSLYVVAFTYEVEDAFLNAQLEHEATYQRAEHARTGDWALPRDPRVRLHRSRESLPPAVDAALDAEPERVEFPGPGGSHYHVARLGVTGEAPAWLIYDAGAALVVRPIRAQLLWLLAGTSLLFVGMALAVGYYAVRGTTRRLEALADDVQRLEPWRPARVSATTDEADEVGALARGIEDLRGRIAAFVERERGFTRDASHELRTPLAVIRSSAEQLAAAPRLDAAARRHAAAIHDSALGLQQTVDALLALARDDDPPADARQTALLPQVERTVVEQSPRLDGKSVHVHVDVPRDLQVQVPPAVVRILLANVVGNAFSHTSSGVVRIEVRDGRLRVLNPRDVDSPQMQGDGVAIVAAGLRRPGRDGFGFGLQIVQRLCERFGLDFRLEFEGSDVVASLPLAAASRTGTTRDGPVGASDA